MKANIVLIGSGNVATHLGKRLIDVGHQVLQVYSPQLSNARTLATALSSDGISSLDTLLPEADFYIIAVSDHAILQVIHDLQSRASGIWLHTSGSTDIKVFEGLSDKFGVLYPLQTFSKQKDVDFTTIPLAIEANNDQTYRQVEKLAQTISGKSFYGSSKQRLALHVSAVFACNFTNYMYAVAENILQENDLGFDMIKPLILETAEKALHFSPKTVQTGPAIRRDTMILEKHIKFLQESPLYSELYSDISRLIMNCGPDEESQPKC